MLVQRICLEAQSFPHAARKFNRTRCDAIDAYALRRAGGLRGRVMDHRRLGRPIRRRAGRGLQAGDRGNVQDRTAGLALEQRQRSVRGSDHRHHVDRIPGCPGSLVVADAKARSIVDQNVDAAHRRGRTSDEARHRVGIGQIARRSVHAAAEPADLGAGSLQRRGAARANRYVSARGRKTQRNRSADAAAATGHDNATVLKSCAMTTLLQNPSDEFRR